MRVVRSTLMLGAVLAAMCAAPPAYAATKAPHASAIAAATPAQNGAAAVPMHSFYLHVEGETPAIGGMYFVPMPAVSRDGTQLTAAIMSTDTAIEYTASPTWRSTSAQTRTLILHSGAFYHRWHVRNQRHWSRLTPAS